MEDARILIVDDKPENLLALEGVLRGPGREIHTATSGTRALELLMQNEFALALLDVQMPEMSGFDLAEMMRSAEDTRHIPIIFVTAGVHDMSVAFRGFDAGAVDFLFKPLNEKIIRSKVQVFLELDRQKRLLREQIHKLETSEIELRESQAALAASNSELERFVYVASHDMKEPLRMIGTYISLFLRKHGAALEKESAEYLSHAVSGAKRLGRLLESLVLHSRMRHEALQKTVTNCNNVVNDVLEDLSRVVQEKKAQVDSDPLPDIVCDREQFHQLIQNLVSNAIKFTKERAPEIKISCEPGENSYVFRVADNGIGIPEKQRKKIFDPFFRGHHREDFAGDGIGLSVCKTIVERHGGNIWVEDNEAGGSTFAFVLPKTPLVLKAAAQ